MTWVTNVDDPSTRYAPRSLTLSCVPFQPRARSMPASSNLKPGGRVAKRCLHTGKHPPAPYPASPATHLLCTFSAIVARCRLGPTHTVRPSAHAYSRVPATHALVQNTRPSTTAFETATVRQHTALHPE